MSIEYLNVINSSEEVLDASTSKVAGGIALLVASLDINNNPSNELQVPLIYNGIATGFGQSFESGKANTLYQSNIKIPANTIQFGGYLGNDDLVDSTLSNFAPVLGDSNSKPFQAVSTTLNALFCSSSINKFSIAQTRRVIGAAFRLFSQEYPSYSNYLSDSGYSDKVIGAILSQSYQSIFSSMLEDNLLDSELPVNYYSYFDTTGIFTQVIDYQKMADSEAKYYYLSGKIIFENDPENLNPCSYVTYTGVGGSTYEIITNLPCVDSSASIKPIQNLSFYRVFPDAPNVSGSENLMGVFKEFNYAADPQMHNYRTELHSDPSLKGALISGFNTDLRIYDSIDDMETGQCPQSPNLTGYSLSHIGGNSPRWRVTGYLCDEYNHCTPLFGLMPMTGFKIIPLSLDPIFWSGKYSSLRTNPEVPLESKLIRALNLKEFLATSGTNESYVGGPIVKSENFELPCIYLSEQFYNKTMSGFQTGDLYFGTFGYGKSADSLLRPVINGQWITGIGKTGESYDAGDTGNYPKINFSFYLQNTALTGEGSYYSRRCLGMGDGGAEFGVSGIAGSNLGHIYEEIVAISGDTQVPTQVLNAVFNSGIIGNNGSKNITFVDGFNSGAPTGTSKVYGYSEQGDLIQYNYFQPGGNIPFSGWPYPFPIPSGASQPIYVTQPKENYLPRYSFGPFSSQGESFLYPSASGINNLYPSGFPLEVEVNITITEHIARRLIQAESLQYNSADRAVENLTNISVSNSTFDSNGNFISSLISADQNNPIKTTGQYWTNLSNELKPDSFAGVPVGHGSNETWVPSYVFYEMFSGLNDCPAQTGLVSQLFTNSVSGTVIQWNDVPSGFYFLEYVTGAVQSTTPAFGLNFGYKFQATASNSSGVFQFPAYGSQSTLDGFYNSFPHPDSQLSQPIAVSFYHSGGDVTISGNYPNDGSFTIPEAVSFRLVKDCELVAPYYLKYYDSNINNAGWKYSVQNGCFTVDVYPSGVSPWESVITTSQPIFTKGVRKPFQPYANCFNGGFGGYPVDKLVLWHSIINGVSVYSDVPKNDTSSEFDLQNSVNLTLTLRYIPPSFRVFDNESHPEYADSGLVYRAIPVCNSPSVTGSPIAALSSYSGNTIVNRSGAPILDGYDPIWLETVGGNTGISGGYHSKGIVGDGWIGLFASGYGIDLVGCNTPAAHYQRNPVEDNYIVEVNLRPGIEASIHTRALTITPGYIDSSKGAFVNYDLTGIEQALRVFTSTESLNGLVGLSQTFTEYQNIFSDIYWPSPYNGVGSFGTDSFGNFVNSGLKNYWAQYLTAAANPAIIVSGFQMIDKSRVNFIINSIKVNKFGPQPTDTDRGIVLTGQCFVSGEFGYHSQAESAVFTEGVFLKDASNGPLTGFYNPSYASDALLRLPLYQSGTSASPIGLAPTKCVTRQNVAHILQSGNTYIPHLTQSPYFYNRYVVPAMSDLSMLNRDTEYAGDEAILANDGRVFPNSVFALSASVGQHKGTTYEDFVTIPNKPKDYYVVDIKQFYDSSVTDSVLNAEWFIGTGRGPKVRLTQSIDSTGFSAPANALYSLFKMGMYNTTSYESYDSGIMIPPTTP